MIIKWRLQHWNKIRQYYSKSAHFKDYKDFFEDFYLEHTWTNLSELNQFLIKEITNKFLALNTVFDESKNYDLLFKKAERVRELLTKVKADIYISGPSGKNYLSEDF